MRWPARKSSDEISPLPRSRGAPLARHSVEQEAGGHRRIERRDAAQHRNAKPEIAVLEDVLSHAWPLGADDQRERSIEARLPGRLVARRVGGGDPQACGLQLFQGAREIDDTR